MGCGGEGGVEGDPSAADVAPLPAAGTPPIAGAPAPASAPVSSTPTAPGDDAAPAPISTPPAAPAPVEPPAPAPTAPAAVPGGPVDLPTPTAPCPEIVDGVVTFAPAGLAVYAEGPSWNPGPVGEPRDPSLHTRDVTIWLDPVAVVEKDGPVVFYWYGTGSSPREAEWGGLTRPVIDGIKAEGGIIVLPSHDGENPYPWYIANGRPETYDLMVADEVLACAIEQLGVDTRRIHSLGLSAGGMQTTQMAYLRSNYIASVVSYSGGLSRPPEPVDPSNRFAHMGTHGGATDTGGQLNFMTTTLLIDADLKARGHFSVVCDDSPNGHGIPRGIGPFAWRFLEAHPYGTDPSPWKGAWPADASPICSP